MFNDTDVSFIYLLLYLFLMNLFLFTAIWRILI